MDSDAKTTTEIELAPGPVGDRLAQSHISFAEPHPPVGSLMVLFTANVLNLYGAAMAPTHCSALARTRSARIDHLALILVEHGRVVAITPTILNASSR
jgi:hypothetical protein